MKKSLISAAILASLGSLTLSGCFSSSSSGGVEPTVDLSGSAVDGVLSNMECYADDGDGKFTTGVDTAASGLTGLDGYYTASVPATSGYVATSCRSTADTVDQATGNRFTGQFTSRFTTVGEPLAYEEGSEPVVNLTPITTLITHSVDSGVSLERTQQNVRSMFGSKLADTNLFGNPAEDVNLSQAAVTINMITSQVSKLLARQAGDTTDQAELNAIYENALKGFGKAVNAKLQETPDSLDLTDGLYGGLGTVLQNTVDNATSLLTNGAVTTNPESNILKTAVESTLTQINTAYTDATDPAAAQKTADSNAVETDLTSVATDTITIADGVVDTSEIPVVSGTSGSTSTAVSAVSGGTQ